MYTKLKYGDDTSRYLREIKISYAYLGIIITEGKIVSS